MGQIKIYKDCFNTIRTWRLLKFRRRTLPTKEDDWNNNKSIISILGDLNRTRWEISEEDTDEKNNRKYKTITFKDDNDDTEKVRQEFIGKLGMSSAVCKREKESGNVACQCAVMGGGKPRKSYRKTKNKSTTAKKKATATKKQRGGKSCRKTKKKSTATKKKSTATKKKSTAVKKKVTATKKKSTTTKKSKSKRSTKKSKQ